MMTEVVRQRVGIATPAYLVLPVAWHVADPWREPAAEARRLASTWSTLGDPVVRGNFERIMAGTFEQARVVGASTVAVLSGEADVPVAASLTVADLRPGSHSPTSLEVEWLAAGRTPARVSLPVGPAVVSTRMVDVAIDELADAQVWELQAAIPHGISGGLLVTVSTPMIPIAAHVQEVAMGILATLRWHHDWRR